MNYSIDEYEINSNLIPTQLSFFPENIIIANNTKKLIYTESIVEVNRYFKSNNLNLEIYGGEPEFYRSRKSAEIYLPAIFFSISVISENSNLISVTLNLLSNYIYDALRGTIGVKKAHIEFHIETKKKGKIKRINYKGDIEGLKDLEKIIKAIK